MICVADADGQPRHQAQDGQDVPEQECDLSRGGVGGGGASLRQGGTSGIAALMKRGIFVGGLQDARSKSLSQIRFLIQAFCVHLPKKPQTGCSVF